MTKAYMTLTQMLSYPQKIIKIAWIPLRSWFCWAVSSLCTVSLNSIFHIRQPHVIQMTVCQSLHWNIIPEFLFQLKGA